MKLANFARLDPFKQLRNVSGLSQGAKGEEIVWNEFNNNWESLYLAGNKYSPDIKTILLNVLLIL